MDVLCLRYGWQPPLLPSSCVCNEHFTVEHALSCPCGGLEKRRMYEERIREIEHGSFTPLVFRVLVVWGLWPPLCTSALPA